MALPPGPTAPMPLQTVRFVARPVAFFERCRREFGDTFSVNLFGPDKAVFISDPDSIKALFAADRINSVASRRNLVLAPLVGDRSLLLINGDVHLSRRKLMLPPFHGERMRAYEETMRDATERRVASWPLGEAFPLHPSMQGITLDVIMRAVFGVSGERGDRLRELLLAILAATRSPLALGLTLPVVRDVGRLGRISRAIREADVILYAEIGERRADPALEEREDILSMLVAARDEEGEGMDDRDLRDQLVTLLMAGHETTATALAWTFDMLLRHPAVLVRLREEIDAGGTEYLDAVITEALRLRPVVPFIGRDLRDDSTFGGWDLPAGTTVAPAIWLAHTRAENFPDPYAFRPERFLDGGAPTYSWIPFGGGTRRCLGAAFAQFEMRVVLETVLRSVDLVPAEPGAEPVVRRNVTLSPAHGMPVVVERRLERAPAVA
jgi:cytochrome P450 family 135